MRQRWPESSLADLLVPTETFNPERAPNVEFQYIDVSSVSNQAFSITETQRLKGKDAPSRARRLVRKNDVILATIRPTLRRIAVVPEHLDNQVCSTGYLVLRPKPQVAYRFLFYWLFTESFMGQMATLQKGASYPAVTDSEVKSQRMPVPPLGEQRRIVAILDETFASIAIARANAEKNLQNARELFESELRTIFFEEGQSWPQKRLGDVAKDFGRGKSKHRPRNDPELYGGDYPFIQTGDVRNSTHLITSFSQTYNKMGLAQSKLWPKGTLCITIAANIAETGILDFDACFPDSVIGVVADERFAGNKFLEYLLQGFKALLQEQGKGSAQDNINLGTFETQLFPFPDLRRQREVVTKLDSLSEYVQTLESIYQRKMAALDELKQSLLHQAFSGKL